MLRRTHFSRWKEKLSSISDFYLRIIMLRRTHFPRCCSVPLPECPEHSMRNTLPQRLWEGVGGARGRALLRSYTLVYSCWGYTPPRNTLPQRLWQGGKRAAARSFAVRWSRLFLQRLHPNGKRWSRLFLLRLHPNGKRCFFLLTLSFANCNRSFLVLCFCTFIWETL